MEKHGALHGRKLKFEVSHWKRKNCSPSTMRREKFQNPTIVDHFGFAVFEENSIREITRLLLCHHFRKISVFKLFSVNTNSSSWKKSCVFATDTCGRYGRPNRWNTYLSFLLVNWVRSKLLPENRGQGSFSFCSQNTQKTVLVCLFFIAQLSVLRESHVTRFQDGLSQSNTTFFLILHMYTISSSLMKDK